MVSTKFVSNYPSERISIQVHWNPPPHNYYKLNIDGSFSSLEKIGGIVGVICDATCTWKVVYNKKKKPCGLNATFMEALSLLKGAEIAFQQNLFSLVIETNSTGVINLLTDNHNSMFTCLISHCRYWLRKLQNPLIQHMFREGNKVAHVLATLVRTSNTNCHTRSAYP